MLFCKRNFEVEFQKIENLTKFIGIPLFTLFTTLFLTDFPEEISFRHLMVHIAFSFIGVLGIWVSSRYVLLFIRGRCKKMKPMLRIALQLLISSLITVLICKILSYLYPSKFVDAFEACIIDESRFDKKNLYLASILFNFLVNTIYESFFLFLKLSETLVETERFKKESIEAQYQNLTSRLNPHFLFNSLNTLTTIVEEEPKKAVKYIQELSLVYRYVLNSQKSTWTDLDSEMKFTNSYIELLKMRFEENLNIHVGLCQNHLNYYILPLTIQLLIENAVKHNEISNSRPLKISVFCENDSLIVSNNKQLRNIMPSTTKEGLQNIKERYSYLVKKDVIVEDLDKSFTVKVPLIKMIKKSDTSEIEN